MIQQIIPIASAVLSLAAAFITMLIKFVKNEKIKKALQQAQKVTGILQALVCRAEEFSHFNGEEKKQFVMTKANQFAIDNGLFFDGEEISRRVDELISTTKRVNARDRDRIATEATVGSVTA